MKCQGCNNQAPRDGLFCRRCRREGIASRGHGIGGEAVLSKGESSLTVPILNEDSLDEIMHAAVATLDSRPARKPPPEGRRCKMEGCPKSVPSSSAQMCIQHITFFRHRREASGGPCPYDCPVCRIVRRRVAKLSDRGIIKPREPRNGPKPSRTRQQQVSGLEIKLCARCKKSYNGRWRDHLCVGGLPPVSELERWAGRRLVANVRRRS